MTLITPAEVRAWTDTEAGEPLIVMVTGAVSDVIASRYTIPDPTPESVKVAAMMHTGRLLRRRKTPEGIAQFGADIALRVNKFDPDVAELLSPYAKALVA